MSRCPEKLVFVRATSKTRTEVTSHTHRRALFKTIQPGHCAHTQYEVLHSETGHFQYSSIRPREGLKAQRIEGRMGGRTNRSHPFPDVFFFSGGPKSDAREFPPMTRLRRRPPWRFSHRRLTRVGARLRDKGTRPPGAHTYKTQRRRREETFASIPAKKKKRKAETARDRK